MTIILLTHERELQRNTSTSLCVNSVLREECVIVQWQRKQIDPLIEPLLQHSRTALIYPDESSSSNPDISGFEHFIFLEGTWQEARKMYNHSPWLKTLPGITLSPSTPSSYVLRRNQRHQGLCTAEAVMELLTRQGDTDKAELLKESLRHFQSKYGVSRSVSPDPS